MSDDALTVLFSAMSMRSSSSSSSSESEISSDGFDRLDTGSARLDKKLRKVVKDRILPHDLKCYDCFYQFFCIVSRMLEQRTAPFEVIWFHRCEFVYETLHNEFVYCQKHHNNNVCSVCILSCYDRVKHLIEYHQPKVNDNYDLKLPDLYWSMHACWTHCMNNNSSSKHWHFDQTVTRLIDK